jgi:hypothetical protein
MACALAAFGTPSSARTTLIVMARASICPP